jgi:hypothetical protein
MFLILTATSHQVVIFRQVGKIYDIEEIIADCIVWSLYQNYGSLRVGHPSSPLTVMADMMKSSAPSHCSRVLPDA